MTELYKAYIRLHKNRSVLAEADIPLERAIDFLKENPKNGVIVQGKREIKLEELDNAQNFRSEDKPRLDNPVTGGGEISEDSDRELFESFVSDSESSPECDN